MGIIVDNDRAAADVLRGALGRDTQVLLGMGELRAHLDQHPDVPVVVLGPTIASEDAFALARTMRVSRPALGVILVRHRVDTPTLTDALRAGVRDVVSERDMTTLLEAVQRATELSAALRDPSTESPETSPVRGALITVFSAKGGCGKTTLATNLAAALADKGRRQVCLVDLDLAFGDVAIALQLFPSHTLADAVPLGDGLDTAAINGLLTPHSPGLATLVAPVEPGVAETIPAKIIAAVLSRLKTMFDYVIVDTPPAFTDHVLAAFDESSAVALLATLDIPALKNLKLTLETLDLLNYPRDRWRVVLNRADSKVGLALSEVEKTLRVPIAAQVPSSRAVPASVNRGVPIVLDSPGHPVSEAIKQFAGRLSATTGGTKSIPAPLRTDRRGLLRRRTRS